MKRVYVYQTTNRIVLESNPFKRYKFKKEFPFVESYEITFKEDRKAHGYIVAENEEDALERFYDIYVVEEVGKKYSKQEGKYVYFFEPEIRIKSPTVILSELDVKVREYMNINSLKENLTSMDFIKYITCYQELYKNWMIEE